LGVCGNGPWVEVLLRLALGVLLQRFGVGGVGFR